MARLIGNPVAKRRKKKSGDPAASTALDEFLHGSKKAAAVPAKKAPEIDDRWGHVVETVFDLDPVTLAERLTSELSLGSDASDYGSLRAAVDRAASNLYDAKRLERAAKLEEVRYVEQVAPELELLRSAAREELLEERVKGTGAITKDQIRDKMIQSWPDQVRSMEMRKAKLHAATRVFEGLVDAWNHRNSQLKTMMERASLGRPRQ